LNLFPFLKNVTYFKEKFIKEIWSLVPPERMWDLSRSDSYRGDRITPLAMTPGVDSPVEGVGR